MENRPKKEQERRERNKTNISIVKTFLKKIRNDGNNPQFESTLRRAGKNVFHHNKISRLISRSIAQHRSKNAR
jgi:ribosomal protein S20